MERKNGYLILDIKKRFCKKNQYIGCSWFLIDGKEYMFKSRRKNLEYLELFMNKLRVQWIFLLFIMIWRGLEVLTETFHLGDEGIEEVYIKDVLNKFYEEVVKQNKSDFFY